PGECPKAGHALGQSGDRLDGPAGRLQGVGKGPGGHDPGLAGGALAGGSGRLRPKNGVGAGGNRPGRNRTQGTRAGFYVGSPANLSFNTTLARKSLFLTVPRGILLTSAISSYESPAKWRRAMSSRKSAGRS